MRRHLMKSKIHRATITSADLHYEGSLTLDPDLMAAADLVEYEEIHVVNVNNGQRLVTYVISGVPGSGTVQLNGAAARLGMAGDLVILIAYGDVDDSERVAFQPAVVFVDDANRIVAPPADVGDQGGASAT
jgi:aspartate 1-decarboxylase